MRKRSFPLAKIAGVARIQKIVVMRCQLEIADLRDEMVDVKLSRHSPPLLTQ